MVELGELDGDSLALILWAEDHDGNDDVAVFHGRMEQQGAELFLVRPDGARIPLPLEWRTRIKVVSDPEVAAIVDGAHYALSLSVGSLPEDADLSKWQTLGLKWPGVG